MTRVLVIDDDAGVRLVLQRNLEHAGLEVHTADDGGRGLEVAHETGPDIIVLDLMMPMMDGYDVLDALGRDLRTSAIPVIVLTALVNPKVQDRCRQAGARLVMTKPFEPSALASAIAGILDAERAAHG